MRVLIVEDHAKMAGLLRSGLQRHGLLADVTARGEDALWMAGTTPFDVLILDLMLPGIDWLRDVSTSASRRRQLPDPDAHGARRDRRPRGRAQRGRR